VYIILISGLSLGFIIRDKIQNRNLFIIFIFVFLAAKLQFYLSLYSFFLNTGIIHGFNGLTYLNNVFSSHVQLDIDRCFLLSKLLLNFN